MSRGRFYTLLAATYGCVVAVWLFFGWFWWGFAAFALANALRIFVLEPHRDRKRFPLPTVSQE